MILNGFIDYYLQDLNHLASMLITVKKPTCVMREEHKTDTNIFIGTI